MAEFFLLRNTWPLDTFTVDGWRSRFASSTDGLDDVGMGSR